MYRLCYYDKKEYKSWEKTIKTCDKEGYAKLKAIIYPNLKKGNFIEDDITLYNKFKKIRDFETWEEEHIDHFPNLNRKKYEVQISYKFIVKNMHAYGCYTFLKYDVCEEEKIVYLRAIVYREIQVQ